MFRFLCLSIVLMYLIPVFASVSVTVNGTSHTIPQKGEKGWGDNVTAWIQDISADVLYPAGGSFTLGADVDFGASFGLLAPYYKSKTSDISTAGVLRLANSDSIGWRNNAGSGNLLLGLSTDSLQFNSIDLADISSSQTLTNKTIDADDNTISDIDNDEIKAAAGIALDKLAATTASRVLVSDGSGFVSASSTTSTTLGYLDATSSIQTQLDAKLDDFSGSADNVLVRTDGSSGDAVQESGVSVDDLDNVSGVGTLSMTGDLSIDNQSDLRLFEQDGNGSNYMGLQAPDAVTSDVVLKLPDGDGLVGQAMLTDGSGNLSWGNAGGAGGINYLDFEALDYSNDTAAYDDVSAATDLTGGTPNVTVGEETSNPLSGTTSYLFTKDAADRQHEGWAITSDALDRLEVVAGQTISVSFNYETSANFASDDVEIFIYLLTTGELQACNTRSATGTFGNGLLAADDGAKYVCEFTAQSDTTGFRLGFHIASTNASAYTIAVDRIIAGPDKTVNAPVITDWKEYSLTITGSTSDPTKASSPDVDKAYWRRVGDSAEITYTYIHSTATGSADGSGNYQFSQPPQCTIDETKIAASQNTAVGTAFVSATGEGVMTGVVRKAAGANILTLTVGNASAAESTVGSSFGNITDADVTYSFVAKVPCEEFASAATLSTTQTDHLVISAWVSGDPASASIGNPIISPTASEDDHGIYNNSTGIFTTPRGGKYVIHGSIVSGASAGVSIFAYVNGSIGPHLGTTDAAGEMTFTGRVTIPPGGGTFSVRPGGTLDVTSIHMFVEEKPDFTTFSVSGKYEYKTTELTAITTSTAADTWEDISGSTISSLTAGTWELCYQLPLHLRMNSGSAATQMCNVAITDTSNNQVAGSIGLAQHILTSGGHAQATNNMHRCVETTITATTSYKLRIRSYAAAATADCRTYSADNITASFTDPDQDSIFSARRIK